VRAWLTKAVAILLALCFPWGSAASGGMVLCVDSSGRVGLGPGNGLACAGAAGRVQPEESNTAAPCTLCLDEHGCADVPGKGLLQRAPPGVAERRATSGQGVPYAEAMAQTDLGALATPRLPPAHVLAGEHDMRLRLAALSSVVLRV
jgi:hypothetical protein